MRTRNARDDQDWAWRPPSGGIEIGESEDECARRELLEEIGLDVAIMRVGVVGYPTFVVEVPRDCSVEVSEEHDRSEWVSAEELIRRCRPQVVSEGIERAL